MRNKIIVDCDMVLLDVLENKNNIENDNQDDIDFYKFCSIRLNEPIQKIIETNCEYGRQTLDKFIQRELNDNYFRFINYNLMTPIKYYKGLIEVFQNLRDNGYRLVCISTNYFDSAYFGSKLDFIQKYYPDCFDSISLINTGICKTSLFNQDEIAAIIDDNPFVLNSFKQNIAKISPDTYWTQHTKTMNENVKIYQSPEELNKIMKEYYFIK